jgi:hypothetical protein
VDGQRVTRKYHPPLEEWQIITIAAVAYLVVVIGMSVICYNVFG